MASAPYCFDQPLALLGVAVLLCDPQGRSARLPVERPTTFRPRHSAAVPHLLARLRLCRAILDFLATEKTLTPTGRHVYLGHSRFSSAREMVFLWRLHPARPQGARLTPRPGPGDGGSAALPLRRPHTPADGPGLEGRRGSRGTRLKGDGRVAAGLGATCGSGADVPGLYTRVRPRAGTRADDPTAPGHPQRRTMGPIRGDRGEAPAREGGGRRVPPVSRAQGRCRTVSVRTRQDSPEAGLRRCWGAPRRLGRGPGHRTRRGGQGAAPRHGRP